MGASQQPSPIPDQTPIQPEGALRLGEGIEAEQLREIQRLRGLAEPGGGAPGQPQRTPAAPGLAGGPTMSELRTASVGQLAQMRNALRERREMLLARFREILTDADETLVSRHSTGASLLNGARSNLERDRAARDEIADSWNPFMHVASSDWLSKLGSWDRSAQGVRSNLEDQVRMSERMVADHEERMRELDVAIYGRPSREFQNDEAREDARAQRARERAAEREQVLAQMEQLFQAEERRLQLAEDMRRAQQQGNNALALQLQRELQQVETTRTETARTAEQSFGGLLRELSVGDPSEMFAKHRASLREMNDKFDQSIQALNSVEEWARLGVEIAIIVAAGAVAMSTAGAGTPILLAALYGGLAGAGLKAVFHTTEVATSVAVGNYEFGDERFNEEVLSRTKDTAWTGVECFVSGLGAGWAGRAARFQKVALKMASSGRFSSGLRGLGTLAQRNTNWFYRNSFAVRNAWRMATPNTFFHTALDLHSGRLSSNPSAILTNIAGQYAIASLCAGNAQLMGSARQRVMDTAGKKIGNQIFGRVLNTGLFAAEGALDVWGTDRSMLYLDMALGKDVNSEQYKYEREQRFKMAGLGFVAGHGTNWVHNSQTRGAQRRVDTLEEGMTRVAQDTSTRQTGSDQGSPRIVVEAVDSPGTSSNRLPSEGKVVHQVSMDPRYAAADAAAASGTAKRVAVRSNDTNGDIDRATARSRRQATTAVERMRRAAPGRRTGVRDRERTTLVESLDGVQQRPADVDTAISSTLGNRMSPQDRAAVVADITSVKRGSDAKVQLVEDRMRARGMAMTDAERTQLRRRLTSDSVGEVEDAFARSAALDLGGDAAQRKAALEADAKALIGEVSGTTRRNQARNGLDAGDHRMPVDSDGIGAGMFSNARARAGKFWSWVKDKPILGHAATAAEQVTVATFGLAGGIVNTPLSIVSAGPLRLSTQVLGHLGVAGFQSMTRSVANTKNFGRRMAEGSGSPRDAMRALALSEQCDHRLRLIADQRRQGVQIDDTYVTALQQAKADADAMFARSDRRPGRGRFSRMLGHDSQEEQRIRSSIRQAADGGLGFTPRPAAPNPQNGPAGNNFAAQRIANRNAAQGNGGRGGGGRPGRNPARADDDLMDQPVTDRVVDRSQPYGEGSQAVFNRRWYNYIVPDAVLPSSWRTTAQTPMTYRQLAGGQHTQRAYGWFGWFRESALGRSMFGKSAMAQILDS